MKTISIINYKGGVGKTTLSTNIASGLVQKGYSVLAIDLDPQTNFTFSYIKVDKWAKKYKDNMTIKTWFDSIIEDKTFDIYKTFNDLIITTDTGLDIISSHLGLIDVDMELAVGLSGSTPKQHKINFLKTYSYIRKALSRLNKKYDYVIFDCPPNFNIVTKNAIIASDYYLVPAKMDFLSTLGIHHLQNHVNALCNDYNSYCDNENNVKPINPIFLGVIATMVQLHSGKPIASQKQYISEVISSDVYLFDSKIRTNNTFYPHASASGQPLILSTDSNHILKSLQVELNELIDEIIMKVCD